MPLDGGLGFEVLADLRDDPRRAVHFGRFGMTYAEEIQESLVHLDLDMDELDEAFAPFCAARVQERGEPGQDVEAHGAQPGAGRGHLRPASF